MNKLKMKPLIVALCGLGAIGSANAAIVSIWDVTAVANFDPLSITPGGGVVTPLNTPVVPTQLRWGTSTGSGQSGLDITNLPSPVQVNTSISPSVNLPVATTIITHLNQPVTGSSLTGVNLLSTLTLKPNTPAFPAFSPVNITFGITFLETPNAGGVGGACAGGGFSGQAGVNANGCADIFVIDKNALNFSFSFDTDGVGGDPAQTYFISFLETTSGLNPLNATACLSATGSNTPCLGFLTPEGANTPVTFGALISTERVVINVPEPGIVGLLGLSFGLMGFAMRRKTCRASC